MSGSRILERGGGGGGQGEARDNCITARNPHPLDPLFYVTLFICPNSSLKMRDILTPFFTKEDFIPPEFHSLLLSSLLPLIIDI